MGGAVFEVKEPILPNPNDYRILFDRKQATPAGTIVRSSTPYNATSIPLAVFTIEKCGVLSFHFHPLGAEQLLVLHGV
jgi:quercetin dioxygenase-like cupin family protein